MANFQRAFSLKERLKSFSYALAGLRELLRTEHNSRVHLACSVAVIVLSSICKINKLEIAVLLLAMSFVWIAEIFNTAIEKTMNFISTERLPKIRVIKDLAAAAVFIAAVAAFITGCIIFLPKIFS